MGVWRPGRRQLTGHFCPEGLEAACSRSSCTGSELLAAHFRPISRRRAGTGRDPAGCSEWPLTCLRRAAGRPTWELSGPPVLASLVLSPVDAEHAGPGVECAGVPAPAGHYPQVTGWPGCLRRKGTSWGWHLLVAAPGRGPKGERCSWDKDGPLPLPEHLPGLKRTSPPPRPSPCTDLAVGSKVQGKNQITAPRKRLGRPRASGHSQAELSTCQFHSPES